MTAPVLASPHGFAAAWRRIAAMVLRYSYLIRGSWTRVIGLI